MSKTIDPIQLFESIIGKKPDAFLHEPVYQVTESEIREFARVIAAPVVERQESDLEIAARLVEGKTVSVDVSTCDEDAGNRLFCKIVEVMEDGDSFTLLAVDPEPNFETSPPAPVAVVLPENCSSKLLSAHYVKGWNACLDKVKELNQ